jgi:hypothetical protein
MVCLVFFGTLARCLATKGELWLDEAWSVVHISSLSSAIEIFTKLRHDNNHLLTSLWIYICGVESPSWLLRAPSALFGAATLLVIARWAPRYFGKAVAQTWLMLCAASYPLTLYSSEARGYALLVFCATAGFLLLSSLVTSETAGTKRVVAASGFAALTSIGALSHAAFALFVAPAIVWLGSLYATRFQAYPSQPPITWPWLRMALTPVLLLGALLTALFYGHLEIGGGPVAPYLQVFFTYISTAFGGDEISASKPALSLALCFASGCILIALLAETFLWVREKDPIAVLVVLLLATPVAAVILLQPHFILARYFIFQVLILYLVAARFLVRVWNQNLIGCAVTLSCIAFYLLGNGLHTAHLLTQGRSHFQGMLNLLQQCTNSLPTAIAADQVFQFKIRLHYAQLLKTPGSQLPLTIISNYDGASSAAEYVVRETFEHLEILPDEFIAQDGHRYRAQCDSTALPFYQGALLSGASLRLYRSERSAGIR